jgi:hypothetical protein
MVTLSNKGKDMYRIVIMEIHKGILYTRATATPSAKVDQLIERYIRYGLHCFTNVAVTEPLRKEEVLHSLALFLRMYRNSVKEGWFELPASLFVSVLSKVGILVDKKQVATPMLSMETEVTAVDMEILTRRLNEQQVTVQELVANRTKYAKQLTDLKRIFNSKLELLLRTMAAMEAEETMVQELSYIISKNVVHLHRKVS